MKVFVFFMAIILSMGVYAKEIPVAKSRQVAVNFINDFENINLTQNDIASVKNFLYKNKIVLRAVNFKNNIGYVLVSADDAAYPVLGYVKGQVFDTSAFMPQAYQNLLEDYSRQIVDIRQRHLSHTKDITARWEKYSKPSKVKGGGASTGPLLTTIWSQGCYFNDSCPSDPSGPCQHVVTGCVATAMSQVINYYNFPPNGSGIHSYQSSYGTLTANFGNTTYNWSLMADTLNASTPAAKVAAVAQLISQCGISVDMMYSAGGSGAYSEDAMRAFTHYFNFSNDMQMLYRDNYADSVWENMLRFNLDSVGPLYYDGTGTGGHAFVCDGYQNQHYFHYNWGWNGSHNGYFLVTNLNPGGMNFGMYNSAIFNMKPRYPSVCSGVTDTLTSPDGNFGDGSSYQNYQNNVSCSWLIAPQGGAQSINLEFYVFSLAAGDTVRVYDGGSVLSPVLAVLTGDSLPQLITSTGDSLFVTFITDTAQTGQGWSATYYTDFCSGTTTLTSSSGQFSDGSGNYDYHNNSDCKWLISPPSGLPIHLHFNSFKTELGYDFVKVYDGSTTSGQMLGNFSGDSLPPDLVATSGNMLVHFTSDGGMVDDGWSVSYFTCDTLPLPLASSSGFCTGDSVMIYTSAVYDSIVWFSKNIILGTDSSFWTKNGGSYYYKAYRQGCGWDSSASIKINQFLLPQPNLGSDTLICTNYFSSIIWDTLISIPNNFSAWLWSTGDTTPFVIIDTTYQFISKDSVYWVMVTDSNGCVGSDTVTIRFQICEGIKTSHNVDIQVFPNPAGDIVYWEINDGNRCRELSLWDVSGREIFRGKQCSEKGKISLKEYKSGIYIFRVITSDYLIEKIIIKR